MPSAPSHVLTLVVDPSGDRIDDTMASRARVALADAGAEVAERDWLEAGVALDLPFQGLDPDLAVAAAREAVAGKPVDAVAQALEGRRKSILVADMESTIIRQEMLDELGDLVGLRERIAAVTARAMNGEIDFKDALRERVALLQGLSASVLDELQGRIEWMPGAVSLLATLKRHGVHCALVSGGFKPFTSFVRARLGFDEDRANDLEISDGKLTGRPVEPVLDKDSKLEALKEIAGSCRVPLARTLTVGDGANDVPMLLAAGLGVAFRAKPAVAAEARARVDHGDLTALLYVQGYRAAEISRP